MLIAQVMNYEEVIGCTNCILALTTVISGRRFV